jgi:hypothetical protein
LLFLDYLWSLQNLLGLLVVGKRVVAAKSIGNVLVIDLLVMQTKLWIGVNSVLLFDAFNLL